MKEYVQLVEISPLNSNLCSDLNYEREALSLRFNLTRKFDVFAYFTGSDKPGGSAQQHWLHGSVAKNPAQIQLTS